MSSPSSASSVSRCTAVFNVMRTGLNVLGAELGWMASGVLHAIETRQLRKRIIQEEASLGRALLEDADASTLDAIRKRITFLHDETERFATMREAARERHVTRLRERFGNGNETVQS
ncbi:hypothetical protein [Nitratidesulfovibrio vulgaris]|uniref:hypothetical protein n=1 Tax=Nitratidesulfovibrio vulgaris TaxID=881 RepID=UPI0013E006C8|nr:hypothetical protein [Nitratidesulfovibrio vulgaris]